MFTDRGTDIQTERHMDDTHKDSVFSSGELTKPLNSSKSSRESMCRLPTCFLLNIQSRVKQEVDIPQIQNCITRYSSPY